jgi:hypothetical protein
MGPDQTSIAVDQVLPLAKILLIKIPTIESGEDRLDSNS